MRIHYFIIFFIIALIFNNCKSQKANMGNSNSNSKIESFFIIGSGGGFTGKYNQFKVYNSGKIQKLNDDKGIYDDYSEMEPEMAMDYFKELENLHLDYVDFNHPGNMTFFIEIIKDENTHIVKWGDDSHQIDDNIKTFFENLMTEIYKKER